MINQFLEIRLEYAERYYATLSVVRKMNWVSAFEYIYARNQFGLPESMTLIHKNWFEELGLTHVDPRGPKYFTPAPKNSRCQSIRIWNYECPIDDPKIHVDHTFPRAKGGYTHYQNAMYLCEEHNLDKSSDIHIIPWETFPTQGQWISTALNTHLEIANARNNTEFYYPKSFLSISRA